MRHEKIVLLSDGAFRAWVMTLAAGAEQSRRWRFASIAHLVRVTGRAETEMHELISVHLLDMGPRGEVWIHDWQQWQERYASDFSPPAHRNGSAKTPSTLREDSANAPNSLPPDVRRETGELRRETETSTPLPPPPQAEEGEEAQPSADDCQLWRSALDHLSTLKPGNREQVNSLEPIGRAPDGGLRLRAPPGHRLARFRPQIARALADAGDAHGTHVQIIEA
jgi:hypothetical protein